MTEFFFRKFASPVGTIYLLADEEFLRAIVWEENPDRPCARFVRSGREEHPLLTETERQLREYFAGRRKSFDLPISPTGTDFQLAAWRALREISYGQTLTYAEQAAAMGRPRAVRAVAAANGRNPLSIVIPCHRVTARDSLGGYAGGRRVKKFLLDLEKRNI
ncbi:MAG TPA: methylated-DNA--[protein]-cysteine S-methyltransferase [Candidatus Moranbacteria bacterium]|nr:methylated-DNA--[protein]-cysteine S-methyltransferase [Candidatus Moranbacteria bacterium]